MPGLIWCAIFTELIRLSPVNAGFLFALQFVNGMVLFIQEKKSADALEAVKFSLEPKALVKRDGVFSPIMTSHIVIGDKILITSGDFLPADCVAGPGECIVDQSMLTGETSPVKKTEGGKLYMGSIVKKGEIEAVVTATGPNTFFGKANSLMSKVNSKGKIQRVLGKVAFILIVVAFIIVSVILLALLLKGNEFLESLSTSFVYMILSLPIAMQTVSATILSVGAQSLNKKNVAVCSLASIEGLAGIDILCVHKSGIITKDEPIVKSFVLFGLKTPNELFLIALLASRKDKKNGIDKCVSEYALDVYKVNSEIYEEEDFFHYDPKLKRSEATLRNTKTGEIIKCSKGAVPVILALTGQSQLEEEVNKHVNTFASQGHSVIAVASTDSKGVWEFGGLISIHDPYYNNLQSNIQDARALNLKLIFLTGDQLAITKTISNDLRLGDLIFNAEIFNNDLNTVQREIIDSILLKSDGFAQVYPEHKFTIVKMLQNKKKSIGITGVSISDAAALKRADVGLAGFIATDAAKSASDLILLKPGFEVIIQAVAKSRKIFRRAHTYCIYRISCSFQLLVFFFVGIISVDPSADFKCNGTSTCETVPNTFGFPVIALAIIALLNDGTIISISYDKSSTSKYPCKWKLSQIFILSCTLGVISFFSSLIFLLMSMSNMDSNDPNSVFNYFDIGLFSYEQVLTSVFLKISISNYLTIFCVRTDKLFFMSLPGKALGLAGLTAMTTTTLICRYWYLNILPKNSAIIANMESISWKVILFVWVFDLSIFVLQDFIKVLICKGFDIYNKII
jgi:H+-transporting ATPase